MVLKRIIIFAVLIFAGCSFGEMNSQAQIRRTNILYDAPVRLMLKGDENAVSEAETGTLLREVFYPIGWSKNGAFAYYVEPADEACGCYFARLVIQNLQTDKILWKRDYNSENGGADTLKKYWKKNRKEFSRKLAEYKIVASKNFTSLASPLTFQNDVLTAELIQNIEIEDIFAKGIIVLRLISKASGAKTIYEKKYLPKDYSILRSAEIGGILQSPFEPRAAIILVETYRGWEGPPDITRINVIGTNLTTGFR